MIKRQKKTGAKGTVLFEGLPTTAELSDALHRFWDTVHANDPACDVIDHFRLYVDFD
jgi:hypothetical protein